MAKKKILFVCQHYWPESFRINDIADFFMSKGDCDIDVLCGIPNYPRGQFYEGYSVFQNRLQTHKGVSIRRTLEIPRGNNSNLRIFLNYISFPLASLMHVPRLLFRRYDKIFIYQLSPVMMSIAGIVIGKIKRTETTMYVLDLWPENLFSVLPIQNRILKATITRISHWHYRNVDKIVVLSEKMKDRIIEITGINNDKITILPQACEKLYENDIRDEKLASRFKGKFNILYTGNISPAQSFGTIIDAAKILRNRGIDNINWLIVGDGMSRDWLETQVEAQGLKDMFVFEGQKPVEDIPRYTPLADVLVGCLVKSNLLEATVPAKVMSYLAAGRPVVLAMDGEVQSLVNDTIKCGYVGPTEDSSELATNIQKIYSLTDKERYELGANARKYHFEHFERNLILSKLNAFIFDVQKVQ